MNNNCICLICYKPNDIWFDFLSKFTKYDIYIIIDDNTKDYKEQYSIFSFTSFLTNIFKLDIYVDALLPFK